MPTATFNGGRQVINAILNRVGPAAGLLFFPVIMLGFSIHGYPDIGPTDAQLAKWLAGVDQNTFQLGVYIEALGTVLFIPFGASTPAQLVGFLWFLAIGGYYTFRPAGTREVRQAAALASAAGEPV